MKQDPMKEDRLAFTPPPRSADGHRWFNDPSDFLDHIDIATLTPREHWEWPPLSGASVLLGDDDRRISDWDYVDIRDAKRFNNWGLPYGTASVSVIATYLMGKLDSVSVMQLLAEAQRVLRSRGLFISVTPHFAMRMSADNPPSGVQWTTETYASILSEPHYINSVQQNGDGWKLEVGHNFLYGANERKVVLVTQLVRQ